MERCRVNRLKDHSSIWEQQRSGGAALTSENIGSFLAKSTTRVIAGVMILVNSLKASRSTLSPSDVGATGDWPILSGCAAEQKKKKKEERGLIRIRAVRAV